jgi:hypothetical protein
VAGVTLSTRTLRQVHTTGKGAPEVHAISSHSVFGVAVISTVGGVVSPAPAHDDDCCTQNQATNAWRRTTRGASTTRASSTALGGSQGAWPVNKKRRRQQPRLL